MSARVVAVLALPLELDDFVRVAAGLARAYPGAVIGDSDDPRVLVVEDPHAPAGADQVDLRAVSPLRAAA